MHRSSSGSRVSEDSVVNSAQHQSITTTTNDSDHHHYPLHLPTYDPLSHAAKRERSRIRSAENAIHLIPLVLVLCAIILWFFSGRPVQEHVEASLLMELWLFIIQLERCFGLFYIVTLVLWSVSFVAE